MTVNWLPICSSDLLLFYSREHSMFMTVSNFSQPLSKDMGEEYTEMEIGLTENYLDPDGLGTIQFSEFVHWWCE